MVIINQIENDNDWEYIGSDIGIAIACVMKRGKKRNITWDEEDHVYAPRALNKQKSLSEDFTVADDGHQHRF